MQERALASRLDDPSPLDAADTSPRQSYQPSKSHPDEADLDLKVGETDSSGNQILAVYAKKKNRYAIYEITGNRVIIKGDFSLADRSDLNRVLTKIAYLTASVPLLKLKYNPSLGHAMTVYLDGDTNGANEVLRRVYDEMVLHLTRRGKAAYLGGAALMMSLVLVAFLITRFLTIVNLDTEHVIWAIVCASIGGFLSVALGATSRKIDLHDSFRLNLFNGVVRILIAIICGVILYFLIQAEFVLSIIKHDQEAYGYIIVFFLSGFSEKLVPNLLTRLDQSSSAYSPIDEKLVSLKGSDQPGPS